MSKDKIRKCMDCGTTENLWSTVDRCFDCSMKRIAKNIKAMKEKKGPEYDKYLESMKKRFT